MTPKEKAEDLVGKMCLNDCTNKNIDKSKVYALIAVDEIIDTIKTTPGGYFMTIYWQDVKKEIEQL